MSTINKIGNQCNEVRIHINARDKMRELKTTAIVARTKTTINQVVKDIRSAERPLVKGISRLTIQYACAALL